MDRQAACRNCGNCPRWRQVAALSLTSSVSLSFITVSLTAHRRMAVACRSIGRLVVANESGVWLSHYRKGATVIRQVITCEICGSQKQQTNHWFVAYEESGELRISGWNTLHLFCPETKHLCGETCAHKLISHFLMGLVEGGTPRAAGKSDTAPAAEATIQTAHAPLCPASDV